MDHNEIKLIISRIISGKSYYKGKFYNLPVLDYEAEILYNEYYTLAIFSGVSTNDELYTKSMNYKENIDFLIQKKIKDLKDAKVDLFNNRKAEGVNFYRQKVVSLDAELTGLFREKNIFYNYSAEYMASYIRDITALSKVNKDPVEAYAAMQDRLDDKTIRLVARSGQFFELFSNSGMRLFNKKLTEDQHSLISWFKKYKSIYRHPEKPEDWTIDDDLILDGWLIHISDKKEEKPIAVKGQEVFVFTQSAARAKEVYDSNPLDAKIIIKGRQNKIIKENQIDQFNLPDVKRDLSMQMNRGE